MIIEIKDEPIGLSQITENLKKVFSIAITPSTLTAALSITFKLPPDTKNNSKGLINTENVSGMWVYSEGRTEINGMFHLHTLNFAFIFAAEGTTVSFFPQVQLGTLEVFTSVKNDLQVKL